MSLYINPKIVSAFHIVFVAPLLIIIGLGKFPAKYNYLLVILGVIVAIVHLCRLMRLSGQEFMTNQSGNTVSQELSNMKVHYIRMFDSSPGFETPVLNISQGDVVVWSNVGEVQHTVTDLDNMFDSGYMKPGDNYSIRFTEKGVFNYYSIPDEGWMAGRIIVS
jgi:plastocyanin